MATKKPMPPKGKVPAKKGAAMPMPKDDPKLPSWLKPKKKK
jgi:hypothetical protein